jgi:pantetheine-phosphate adenylyltransferase
LGLNHFKYKSIAVGGTFDHIHKGHRALLKKAFDSGEKVIIGVTSDEFVKASGKIILHNFETRKKQLQSYLAKAYPKRNYEITKLDRNFGPGMFTKEIGAIVVSSETASRVLEANRKRRESGLKDLIVEEVPMIVAQDGNRISSTRIRSGEIDAEGNVLK